MANTRVEIVQHYVHECLDSIKDPDRHGKALGHLYGVSLASVLLAKRRGVDEDAAAIAGLLHDLYAYQAGSYEDHAHRGAEMARDALSKLQIATEQETEEICHAIWCHDDLDQVDGPLDEILKDADVLHNTLRDPAKAVGERNLARYQKLCEELCSSNVQRGL